MWQINCLLMLTNTEGETGEVMSINWPINVDKYIGREGKRNDHKLRHKSHACPGGLAYAYISQKATFIKSFIKLLAWVIDKLRF